MKKLTQHISQALFLALLSLVAATTSFAAEKITYLHNNELGSPIAATDSSGAVLWTESYRPYGERTDRTNTDTNETWYTGKQHDADLGLSYYGARWYDPNVGRFTGIDPVGVQESNVHSFNRYAYANNNPYKYIDPDGNLAWLIIPIFFVADVAIETAFAPEVPFDSGQVQRSYVGLGTSATALKIGKAISAGKGAVTHANFAQNNKILPSRKFSSEGQEIYSKIAGVDIKTVGDLTNALKNGIIKPKQIPVNFVDMNGTRLILNTRTSTALRDAGIPRNKWYGRNVTGKNAYGDKTFNDLASQQLRNNGLSSTGAEKLGR